MSVAAVHHRFEWDADKAHQNEGKHGVEFMLAANVLADPEGDAHHLEAYDVRQDYAEDRWITIGTVPTDWSVILVIAWTMRGDVTRIISARKATGRERTQYEQAIGQQPHTD